VRAPLGLQKPGGIHHGCLRAGIGQSKSNLRLGFDRFVFASFDLQLADGAFSNFDVIAYLAEILRLAELSFGSGMAVEVTDLDNLLDAREWITVRHSDGSHESWALAVQEIQGDGTMAITRFLVRFRANDEGCRSDKLAFEVLSGSPSRIGGVPIFANEAFGIRVVHRFDEGAFVFRCHGRLADPQCLVDTTKEARQVYLADFVGLDAQVGVIHAQQVPDVEMGIGDFSVCQERLRLHKV
jgi:hypothetical protein